MRCSCRGVGIDISRGGVLLPAALKNRRRKCPVSAFVQPGNPNGSTYRTPENIALEIRNRSAHPVGEKVVGVHGRFAMKLVNVPVQFVVPLLVTTLMIESPVLPNSEVKKLVLDVKLRHDVHLRLVFQIGDTAILLHVYNRKSPSINNWRLTRGLYTLPPTHQWYLQPALERKDTL